MKTLLFTIAIAATSAVEARSLLDRLGDKLDQMGGRVEQKVEQRVDESIDRRVDQTIDQGTGEATGADPENSNYKDGTYKERIKDCKARNPTLSTSVCDQYVQQPLVIG
jgi:hypothetical protein